MTGEEGSQRVLGWEPPNTRPASVDPLWYGLGRDQNMPPPNVPLWHMNYSELKATGN